MALHTGMGKEIFGHLFGEMLTETLRNAFRSAGFDTAHAEGAGTKEVIQEIGGLFSAEDDKAIARLVRQKFPEQQVKFWDFVDFLFPKSQLVCFLGRQALYKHILSEPDSIRSADVRETNVSTNKNTGIKKTTSKTYKDSKTTSSGAKILLKRWIDDFLNNGNVIDGNTSLLSELEMENTPFLKWYYLRLKFNGNPETEGIFNKFAKQVKKIPDLDEKVAKKMRRVSRPMLLGARILSVVLLICFGVFSYFFRGFPWFIVAGFIVISPILAWIIVQLTKGDRK